MCDAKHCGAYRGRQTRYTLNSNSTPSLGGGNKKNSFYGWSLFNILCETLGGAASAVKRKGEFLNGLFAVVVYSALIIVESLCA